MRIKVGISLMMALLVIISSCAVTTVSAEDGEPSCSPLTVTKTVNKTYAYYGDTVEFKIVVSYYNDSIKGNCLTNIVVTDTLPPGLEYIETISVEPEIYDFDESGDTLVWDFGDEQLCEQSITIRFTALAIGGNYGENINIVNVTGTELCGPNELSAEDDAIVNIRQSVDVEKTVWDPDVQEWVEYLDGVIKDVDVKFQIVITYYGGDIINCMKVEDEITGYCLEFADNVEITYPNDDPVDEPWFDVSEDLKYITWEWGSDKKLNLCDQESIIIRFDANVTDYCYERCIIENWAYVWLNTCCEPILYGEDCAEVNCRPHDPVFEKTVMYKGEWVGEGYTYIGEEVQFKIELTYYGDYNLTDIEVKDYLPKDILTYLGPTSLIAPMTIPIEWDVKVSEDEKTITWNSSVALNDSETLTIIFKAKVINRTGGCEECGINIAEYTAVESCTEYGYEGEDTAQVHAGDEIGILISVKRLHIGRVSASIRNDGHDDLEDVDWTIDVKGGVLKRVNKSASGTIASLPEDTSKKVSLPWRSILRKGGRVTIIVTATPAGGATIEETFKGIVIGRIILVRPLIRIFG